MDRYMMATKAMHLRDISREKPDLAIIYGETQTHWIGEWATGFGYVNVKFPKETTRELTEDEKSHFRTKVIEHSNGFQNPIKIED